MIIIIGRSIPKKIKKVNGVDESRLKREILENSLYLSEI